MKVRALNLIDLDIASILTYDVIRHHENITPYVPDSYEGIRLHYEKLINHPYDQVFGCFKRNKIVGVLGCIIDINNKQITVVGGPFTILPYKLIGNRFNKFLKDNFASFSVIYSAYEENEKARAFMKSIKSNLFEIKNEYVFKPGKNLFHSMIKLVNSSKVNELKELLKNSRYKYEASKLLQYSDHFHVYGREEKGELVGYCSVKINCNPIKIIEVGSKNNDISIEEKIFEEVLIHEGVDKIYTIDLLKDSLLNEIVLKNVIINKKTIYSYRIDY